MFKYRPGDRKSWHFVIIHSTRNVNKIRLLLFYLQRPFLCLVNLWSVIEKCSERGCRILYSDYASGWRIRGSSRGSGKWSLYSLKIHTVFGAHPASYSVNILGSCLGVKRTGRETDHSSQSSVAVKNGWSCTSAPPVCFHVLDRNGFTFLNLPLEAIKVKDFLWFSAVMLTALEVSHYRFRSFPSQFSVQLQS